MNKEGLKKKFFKQFAENLDNTEFVISKSGLPYFAQPLWDWIETNCLNQSDSLEREKDICKCSPDNNSWRIENGIRFCMRCNKQNMRKSL